MFHIRLSSLSSNACSLCIVSSKAFRVLRKIRTFSAQQQLLSQRLRNDFTSSSFIPELLRSSASSLLVISGIVTFIRSPPQKENEYRFMFCTHYNTRFCICKILIFHTLVCLECIHLMRFSLFDY